MKKLILTAFTSIIATVTYSQILAPVKWSYGAKKVDKEQAVVFIKASIDKGWHIYLLGLDAGLAPELREQMLVIAMSGAAGQKDREGVRVLERRFGGALPADDRYADLRRFLLAWADAPGK